MRILTKLATAALLVSSTQACVTEGDAGGRPTDEQADWRAGGKGDGETCDFDQMSGAAYYAQFAYKARVDGAGTWYRIGATWTLEPILDDGNTASLRVYFLADDRIVAEYYEKQLRGQSEVINQTVIVSHASIDPTTRALTIPGIGSGTPLTVVTPKGCAPGITFKFTADLRSRGLAGDTAVIQSASTSAFVVDPDHLDQVQNADARRYFEEDVASGKIVVLHK